MEKPREVYFPLASTASLPDLGSKKHRKCPVQIEFHINK
jgi:hypothetical protein